ncbi:hypothetical protein [Paraburkholderia tropica]|uniref:hypothetical protein n=1 Tax=Paraburkholderia tropica TaxID=92647 RepID=UPI003D29E001
MLKTDKAKLWRDLAAEHPVSVDLIALLPTLAKEQVHDAFICLLPAIGVLATFSLEDALKLLDFAESIDISYRWAPGNQLGIQIGAKNELGVSIGDALRVRLEQSEAAHRTWAHAFASGAPKIATRYAVGLVSDNPRDVHLLASLFDFLPMEAPEVRSELLPHESQIADLLNLYTNALGEVSWSALASFAKISTTAANYLIEAVDGGDKLAAISAARSLYWADTSGYGASSEPLEAVIRRLLAVGVAHADARAMIDQPISSLVLRDSLRPHVVACLPELCTIPSDVVKMFGETFRGVASHSDDFGMLLSEWLLRSGAHLPSIRSLLSLCTTDGAPVVLDGAAFLAHEQKDTLTAVRRIVALIHHGPILCHFIEAIANMQQLGDARFDLAGQMLNLSFAEYPGATEEFLKEKTKVSQRSHAAAHVFRSVYANVLRWRRVLANLPPLKEIRPTDAEFQTIRALNRRVQRDIMRVAAETSIFSQIATSANVAQGRKFATHSRFGPPQMTPMAQSSHFFELPSSELADPMRGELERRKLLGNAR